MQPEAPQSRLCETEHESDRGLSAKVVRYFKMTDGHAAQDRRTLGINEMVRGREFVCGGGPHTVRPLYL